MSAEASPAVWNFLCPELPDQDHSPSLVADPFVFLAESTGRDPIHDSALASDDRDVDSTTGKISNALLQECFFLQQLLG